MRRIERHAREARQAANELGHTMTQWLHLDNYQYSSCIRCHLWLGVNRDESYGPAKLEKCSNDRR